MKHVPTDCLTTTNPEDKYNTNFPPILDMEIIRRNALDAIASNERIQAYAQFEIYARSQETLTDKEIKELIGFKPPRTGYKYERYKFMRYSKIDVLDSNGKRIKQSTWLIEKFDPLQTTKIKKTTNIEAKNLEILSIEDFGLDEGLENYRNLKKVMAEV